jgi:O-antigen/teichoic acid export membrane protein
LLKELSVKREFVNLKDIKKMFKFGFKSIITGVPSLLVSQTLNITTASILGPAALAVFARPKALIIHVSTFMNKFSFVLTPMVGSIQATEDVSKIREFLIESVKYSIAFTLPIIIFLALLGDHVLNIWMGPEYAHRNLILILSLGYFLPISQGPCLRVLMGINKHGKLAIVNLLLTLVLLPLGIFIVYQIGWSLVNVALLTSFILTLTLGVITPIFACKAIGIRLSEYIVKSFTKPVLIGLVLLIWLFLCRDLTGYSSYGIIGIAFFGQFLLMLVLYWFFMIPANVKTSLLRRKFRAQK